MSLVLWFESVDVYSVGDVACQSEEHWRRIQQCTFVIFNLVQISLVLPTTLGQKHNYNALGNYLNRNEYLNFNMI